jgi:hypothetical protein
MHRFCSSGKIPDAGRAPSSGDDRLRAAIARRRRKRSDARSDDPKPYDHAWGWWIEERIARLERGQTWLIRIAIGALAAETLRIIWATLGIGS